jgi:protein-S-isoprenylcysteine O-methyltransferase Ste14
MTAEADERRQSLTPQMARAVTRRMIQILAYATIWYAVLFFCAGTLAYRGGWVHLGLYFLTTGLAAFLTLRHNPEVAAARAKVHAGAKRYDKFLMLLYTALLFVLPVVAGLDAVRYHWSAMSPALLWPGVVLYLLGAVPVTWAIVVNPFLETLVRIQSERGHHVVAKGPYRAVRHPMYAGILITMLGIPLVLGSWWTYTVVAAVVIIFVCRTALEDRTLRDELPGYQDYTRQTRYRLLPGLW